MKARFGVPKQKKQKEEKGLCFNCPSRFGGEIIGGHCGSGSVEAITCATAHEVTGVVWVELVLARKCKGPEHLKEVLRMDFAEGTLVIGKTPPDS